MRKSVLLLALVALGVLVASGVTLTAGIEPAQAAFPGTNGKILFREYDELSSYGEGDSGIKLINPDGSRLSTLLANGWSPAYSPNSTRVAYSRGSYGHSEIYKLTLSDRTVTQITDNEAFDGNPTWSPDGTRIAFEHERSVGSEKDIDIFARSSHGTGTTENLTKNPAEDDEAPAWSPNGRQIAFQTGGDIFVLTLKSGVRRNLTDDGSAHYDSDPSWSPDGTRIVFESYTPPAPTAGDDFEYDRIYTMNASNGSDRRLLAEASYSYSEGYGSAFNGTTYSPDGKQIAYVVTRTSGFDITSRLVKMNASDGSNKQVVYESYGGNFEGDVYSALFSPDWGVKVQR